MSAFRIYGDGKLLHAGRDLVECRPCYLDAIGRARSVEAYVDGLLVTGFDADALPVTRTPDDFELTDAQRALFERLGYAVDRDVFGRPVVARPEEGGPIFRLAEIELRTIAVIGEDNAAAVSTVLILGGRDAADKMRRDIMKQHAEELRRARSGYDGP